MKLDVGVSVDSLTALGSVSNWFDSAALLDIDRTNNRGRFNGVTYATISALLAAANGTDASGVYTIGPYVDPAGTNFVVNGDGSTTTGWTAGNGSVASVGGKLELTGGGATAAYLSQQLTGLNSSRCYRSRQNVTRATGGPGVFAAQTPSAVALSPSNYQTLVGNVEQETLIDLLWGSEQPTAYIGIKQNGTSTGKSRLDDAETREALAFQGLNPDRISIRLRDVMPASITGTKCLFQTGDDSDRNRIRIDSVDGALRAIMTYANVERANIALGTKAALEAYDIVLTVDEAVGVMAQLDGGVIQQPTVSLVCPGMGRLWLGRSFTGESLGASPARVQIFDDWMPTSALWFEGDSYPGGDALGTSLWASMQSQTSRRGFKTAVGGSTLTNQRDRVLAHVGFSARNTLIEWDGMSNGYGTLSADMAKNAAIAAAKPSGKFVFLTPCQQPASASDVNAAADALRTALLAAYPNNCYDAQGWFAANGGTYQADNIHWSLTTMNAFAPVFDAWMAVRGL